MAFREEEEPAQEDLVPAAEQAAPASAAACGMRAAGPGAQEGWALVRALAGREAVGVVEPEELEEAELAAEGQAPVVQVVLAAQAVEAQVLEGAVGAGQALDWVVERDQAAEALAALAAREAEVQASEAEEEPGLVAGRALALAPAPGAGREEVGATLPQVKAGAAQGPELAVAPE